jgi:hypothetical protein
MRNAVAARAAQNDGTRINGAARPRDEAAEYFRVTHERCRVAGNHRIGLDEKGKTS